MTDENKYQWILVLESETAKKYGIDITPYGCAELAKILKGEQE